MILQYCLSVYSLNFFTKPNFTTFKIRIINQQNGDCSDSRILDSHKLDSNTFPVIIKIKGTERLLIKVKLLNTANKTLETAIGEGVVSFDKNNIDDSLRVPIYDKKRGVEEVAICSLDLFISGHQLDRNTSGAIDKSKSKVDDWRDDSEDAIFSQMSFTVQSDQQLDEEQIGGKIKSPKDSQANKLKQQKNVKQKDYTKEGAQLQINRLQQQKQINVDINSSKVPIPMKKSINGQKRQQIMQSDNKIREDNKQAYPLLNSIYLSEQSRKHFEQSKSPPQDLRKQISPTTIKHEQNESEKQEIEDNHSESENSLSPDRIRERIRQNQDLMQKLRRYLDAQKESQQKKVSSRQLRHKFRKRKVKVEGLGAYNSGNSFIKYYQLAKDIPCKLLNKFKAIRCQSQEINDKSCIQHQIQINKLAIFSPHQEKLAIFDGLTYRSSCLAADRKEVPFSIKIPEERILKVILTLQNLGDFQGTLGVQEGQQMSIKLSRCQNNKNIYNAVLSRDQYQFKFSIEKAKQTLKTHVEQVKKDQDISIKQPEEIFHNEDIKSRIRSLSMQPWGYGQSYLQDLKDPGHLPRIKSQAKPQSRNQNRQVLKDTKDKPKLTSNQQQPKRLKDQQGQLNQTSSYLNEQSEEMSKASSIKQTRHQPHVDKHTQNEIKAINRIRNGNRNNYRFKDSRISRDRDKDKRSSIKQMWERLLIKKKIQQDHLSRENIEITRKQPSRAAIQQEKKNPQKQRLEGRQKTRNASLYGHIEGSREVVKVNPATRQELGGSRNYPLRSMTIEVNNISITEPQAVVDEDIAKDVGKFVRLSIKDKITYYTEIIFNGQFNSILWKLSGCLFRDLLGSEKLEVQIFKTLGNQIVPVGKAAIRASKLYFLRNNHIYNGKIISAHRTQGEFTLGFQVQEFYPFEIVQEQKGHSKRYASEKKDQAPQKSQGQSIRQTKQKLAPLTSSISYERMKSKSGQDLKDTLRRERKDESSMLVGLNYGEDRVKQSSYLEGQEEMEAMPKGLQSFD